MSIAYELMPSPDWAATTTITVRENGRYDSADWARAIFDVRSVPACVKALFGLRQVAVRLIGIPPGQAGMLAVSDVRNGEALIDTDDVHLRFVAGIRAEASLLHVTTAVSFKGLRGRIYFLPLRFLHDPVTRSMMRRAATRAQASTDSAARTGT